MKEPTVDLVGLMIQLVKIGGELEVDKLMHLSNQVQDDELDEDLDEVQKRQIVIAIDAIMGGIDYE